jgi:8-oxo-dGTP pyrophosphatase MutT (NUDIX family)
MYDFKTSEVRVKGEVVRIVVVNQAQRLLLVKSSDRKDVWELPGGKVEKGELPFNAAIRELSEETGLIATMSTLRYVGSFSRSIPHDPNSVWRHYLYTITVTEPTICIDNDEIIDYKWITRHEIPAESLEFTSHFFLSRIKPPSNRQ